MRRTVIAAVAATLVLGAGATGTVLVLQHRAEVAEREERAAERAEQRREREEAAAAREAAHAECVDATSGYLGAVQEIDAVLDVGVNEEDYSDLVRAASVASRQVPQVESSCQGSVVDDLDAVMVLYSAAATEWNDCLYDSAFTCDPDDLDLAGDYWLEASLVVEEVEQFAFGGDPA